MPTLLSKSEHKRKVLGCWLGKAAGGTLGMPYEGQDGPLDLDYYRPIPNTMLPNDDLDLQVLWACVIDKMDTARVDKDVIGEAWIRHVEFPYDEYGVCIRNLKKGIPPPFSGICDNWFYNGMGAAIRSEIWACLAPGNPSLAAKYAYEDACTDHSGDGIWAEVFMSVMESLSFTENDIRTIIIKSASFLPLYSEIRNVAIDTVSWWDTYSDWIKVRAMILEKYGHDNFTDTTQNIGFIILGLLSGNGDFGKTICVAVNCGKDTDCTGASTGAVFGILYPERIEEKWLKPIGRRLILNKQIKGITYPPTIDEFTDLLISLYEKLKDDGDNYTQFATQTEEIQIGYIAENKFPKKEKNIDQSLKKELEQILQNYLFPGKYIRIPKESHKGRVIVAEYNFTVETPVDARIMLSSKQYTMVFLDGNFICAGKKIMIPSFHRAGDGQVADVKLLSGKHKITVFLKNELSLDAEWLFGIGDPTTNLWLVG